VAHAAKVLQVQKVLGAGGGFLVANQVGKGNHADPELPNIYLELIGDPLLKGNPVDAGDDIPNRDRCMPGQDEGGR